MNYDQAKQVHSDFVALWNLVRAKLPKTIQVRNYHSYEEDAHETYELYDVSLEKLTAYYRNYIGCGDYEYYEDRINLKELFKEQE